MVLAGIVFKDILVDKIFNNSPQLLQYYYWTFPFGFGYTLFAVLEPYAWQHNRSAFTNFLKEVLFRFLVTILILLTTWKLIKEFDSFIMLYSFLYIAIVLIILFHLYRRKQL